MSVRSSEAFWEGGLKQGKGLVRLGSGAFEGPYSFPSRFETGTGTNPEELIAAAHAGCFSMAFSMILEREGYVPERIHTTASVKLEKVGDQFKITTIELHTDARVPRIDANLFQKYAEAAKKGCPVSQLCAGAEIKLQAELES